MQSGPCHTEDNEIKLIIKDGTFAVHNTLLGAPYPRVLSLEATNFCNLSCSHCGHSQFPRFSKGSFDMKYFRKIEHLLGSKVKGISLSNFGEPFMSKTWEELLSRSLSAGPAGISFITNGLLLDRHIDEVLDPRISLAISIDGASEETYGFFRGKNNFKKLTANLALLKETKTARGVSYPEMTFLFTVSRTNCGELLSIVDLANAFGVGSIIVQFQIFFDRERFGRESLYFARVDYDGNIASARRRAAELGISLIHPDSFDGMTLAPRETLNSWLNRDAQGQIRCYSQASTCYIKYNGVIEACCAPNHTVMGSLDLDSFEDIWHGPNYRSLRQAFDRGKRPAGCRYCNLIQAIDVHDESAHLIELPADSFEKKPEPQRYSVTELDRIYRAALSFLPGDHEKALFTLQPLLDIDDNLYEVQNLWAGLQGMRGNSDAMSDGLKRCVAIAPGDHIIADNYSMYCASRR